MDPWIAIYDPDSGELLYRAPGSVCQSCRDIVLGTELDDEGRCRTCGPLEVACEDCDCAWPSEDMCSREMRLLCPGCAEDRELELVSDGVWTLADEARSGGV